MLSESSNREGSPQKDHQFSAEKERFSLAIIWGKKISIMGRVSDLFSNPGDLPVDPYKVLLRQQQIGGIRGSPEHTIHKQYWCILADWIALKPARTQETQRFLENLHHSLGMQRTINAKAIFCLSCLFDTLQLHCGCNIGNGGHPAGLVL